MPEEERTVVVGIGASAGGLEAIKGVLSGGDIDPCVAIVIVTHRGERQDHLLDTILAKATQRPVVATRDGAAPEPGTIHVMPPNTLLTFDKGRFVMREPQEGRRVYNAIDTFFDSLAQQFEAHAVGIILSGSGSDGALGLKSIKAHGGLTLVQGRDHSEPLFKGMPDAATGTGAVNLVLPAQDMIARINSYAQALRSVEPSADTADSPAEVDGFRQEICAILRNQVGHDFSGYKSKTFLRRVLRRMHVHQMDRDDYIAHLRAEPEEAHRLFRELLIGVTSFFRDPEIFAALENKVIPSLFEGRGAPDAVRVWVPGCSTGEEVFSIAMLLREHMDRLRITPKVQIFATDIDELALGVARAGRYPSSFLDKMAPDRRKRFFVEEGGICQIDKEIRDLCMFSLHSIVRDPPFSRMDLVSCRNLLIYLDAGLQAAVVPLFHYALRPDGYLMLGNAESLGKHHDLFEPLDKTSRIFVRRNTLGAPMHLLLSKRLSAPQPLQTGHVLPAVRERSLRDLVNRRVLDWHAPAYVVVDARADVIHYSGRTGTFLEAPTGPPNRHLLAIARPELRLQLRSLLDDAVRLRRRVTSTAIPLHVGGRSHQVQVTIEPLEEHDPADLFLVLFADLVPPTAAESTPAERRLRNEADGFQSELHEARERLQGMIEEYETAMEELKSSNEEMISVNEELQSTNEELETSKEELQSINEELHTVNHELNIKVEEVDRANSDLRNIFESTNVATVFLDNQRIVRAYTPAARDVFRLIETDVGRPLTDISSSVDYPEMHDEIGQVLGSGVTRERRIARTDRQRHYLARILPYKASDQTVDGVVVTFVDITQIQRGEEQQAVLLAELNHRVRNMLAVVASLAQISLKKDKSRERFIQRLVAIGRTYELLTRQHWRPIDLHRLAQIEMEPFAENGNGRVYVRGPGVLLEPEPALALGMILHELTTNAVKYGSLSQEGGTLELRWKIEKDGGAATLVLHWQERGGPPVAQAMQPNFGLKLIEQQVRYALAGTIAFDLAPTGLQATIKAPLGDAIKVQAENHADRP